MRDGLRVWVGPESSPSLEAAVERAGGTLSDLPEATAVVWSACDGDPSEISRLLHDAIELVQLDSAGIDHLLEPGILDRERVWLSAKGAYSDAVAEHALALLLAASRELPRAARASSWGGQAGRSLGGSTVGIVGAGGIGRRLIELLEPLGPRFLALTRSGQPVPGAAASMAPPDLDALLVASDYLVLAAPLTPATRGMVGARELGLLGPQGWLINVGRGAVVDTDALVAALRTGEIAGACLDVTEPEPLPDGHPLWSLPNALVTPHTSNPWDQHYEALALRVEQNLTRFRAGEPLLGVVDLEKGY